MVEVNLHADMFPLEGDVPYLPSQLPPLIGQARLILEQNGRGLEIGVFYAAMNRLKQVGGLVAYNMTCNPDNPVKLERLLWDAEYECRRQEGTAQKKEPSPAEIQAAANFANKAQATARLAIKAAVWTQVWEGRAADVDG